MDQSTGGGRPPLHLSEDGRFFWDGTQWKPTLSPDGHYRWDGQQWQPAAPAPPPPPLPPPVPVAPAAQVAAMPPLTQSAPGPEVPAAASAPSWLPPGITLPTHTSAQPAPVQAAPRQAPAAPQRQQGSGGLMSRFLFGRMPAVAVVLIMTVALGVLAVGKLRAPADETFTPVLVANDAKISYPIGVVQRFHEHQTDHGVLTLPNGQKGDTKSDADAVEALRIISVDEHGVMTLGFKFEKLSGYVDGIPIFFDAKKAKEIILILSPDGRIVSGGTNGSTTDSATESVPGGDQVFSIMPDHDVKAGEEWGRDWDRPNPLGAGTMHYSTRSKFLRYDDIFGIKAAVIQTDYKLPIDELLDIHALLLLFGDDGADFPAGSTIQYKGSEDGNLICSLDVASHQIVKMLATSDFEFTMTFQGLPNTPKFAALQGTWHFGGRQVGDLERLS